MHTAKLFGNFTDTHITTGHSTVFKREDEIFEAFVSQNTGLSI